GPAILAVAGFFFWFHAGDLEWVDRLILAELLIVGSGYWLFAFLAATEGDSVLRGTPLRALQTARRLGYRAVFATLLISLIVALHGAWLLKALASLHEETLPGWISPWLCIASGWFWTLFLRRWPG